MKLLLITALLSLLVTGCTSNGAKLVKWNLGLDEGKKQLTKGTLDALNAQPTDKRDNYTETARVLADQNAALHGPPIQPIDVTPLVQSNATAWAMLNKQFAEQNELLRQKQEAERQLIVMGEKYEAERNKSIIRRMWNWVMGSLGITGLILVAIFCPFLLPLIGRFFGFLVSKLPALAGFLGVVGTKSFDSVVYAIDEGKKEYVKAKVPVAVMQPPAALVEESLQQNFFGTMSKEMDKSEKALVRRRRATKLVKEEVQ